MPIALAGQGGTGATNTYLYPGPTLSYSSVTGNTLIATGLVYTGINPIAGITSITDDAGNAWQFSTSNSQNPPSVLATSGGNYFCTFVGWCTGATAITSVTINITSLGLSQFWRVSISEWQGISAGDNGVALTGTNANPTGSVGLTYADDLVVGVLDPASAVPSSLPSGWTSFTGAGSAQPYIGYGTPGTAGLYAAKWLMTSDTYALAVMSFYSAGDVAPPKPGMRAF